MLEALKKRLYNKSIKERAPRKVPGTFSFEKAQRVGIVFNATDLGFRNSVLNYAKHLSNQKKTVKLLGFFDEKAAPENHPFPAYCLKDIDWAGRVKGEVVEQFVTEKFDLLIVASLEAIQHEEYIAAISHAAMKAGPVHQFAQPFDIMMDAGEHLSITQFLTQLETLLKKVK